jgi:hypothetical protein
VKKKQQSEKSLLQCSNLELPRGLREEAVKGIKSLSVDEASRTRLLPSHDHHHHHHEEMGSTCLSLFEREALKWYLP